MRSVVTSSLSVLLATMLVVSPLPAQTPTHPENRAGDLQIRLMDSDGPEIDLHGHNLKGYTFQVTDPNGAAVSDVAVVLRFPDEGPSASFADGRRSAVAYTDASGKAYIAGYHWGDTTGHMAVRITASKGTSHAGLLVEQTIKEKQPVLTAKVITPAIDPSTRPVETPVRETAPTAPAKPATVARSEITLPRPSELQPISVRNEPGVTVSSATPGKADHSNTKKWVIIMAIAAGVGAGAAMAMRGKSSSTSPAATSAVSIGTPTVSVGNP